MPEIEPTVAELAREAIRERVRHWNGSLSPEAVQRLMDASDEHPTDPNDEAAAASVLRWIKAAGYRFTREAPQ